MNFYIQAEKARHDVELPNRAHATSIYISQGFFYPSSEIMHI